MRMTIVSSKSSSKAVKDLVELCYASVDTAGEGMLGLHARRLSLRGGGSERKKKATRDQQRKRE